MPLAEPLQEDWTAVEVFSRLASRPYPVFFDSASGDGNHGRFSFVAVDPFQWFSVPVDGSDALAQLETSWKPYRTSTRPDLPPFQGGAAGLFGYELARSLEKLPAAAIDDLPLPALAIGLYDVVFAFDHEKKQAWIISQGFPETDPQARRARAQDRLNQAKQWLTNPPAPLACVFAAHNSTAIAQAEIAEQFDIGIPNVTSNLSPDAYRSMIEQAVAYIHAGDVFQVNLAQRLLCPARSSSIELYLRLREQNPAPYSGYFDLGPWQICSTSPECFLTLRGNQVETRPIKGTRGRSHHPEADLFAGDELQMSEKDRAENVMIVDLMRNDLSHVCTAESVHVAKLCQLKTYAYVKHLVSVVRGTLRENASAFDLLRACFPGGSITGAPKIRAMEIIAELEPTTRGAYCGSLGYLGFDGQMDSSILIRTVTAGRGWWQLPVGGGIVAQSNPDDEYRETWHKARGLLSTLAPSP
ncbi:MAG: anthranilate synthase component I family protein [Planctomycetes bacterium]|nr:anthranilate synthase component I family protein [Planctomycetota bacterium]